MKIRVADYIAQTLAQYGVKHVFMVTGGGAMHLNDAIGRCKDLIPICCHHEQACAMAAESYFRLSNRLAAVNVTSGPGGTNAITGVFGAWTDSIGMIVISGQVKRETTVRSTHLKLRQLGDQELDIVPMIKTITKYAEMIIDPSTVRYHLEKALYLSTSGRPGPVWLDVPLDVQGSYIDPDEQKKFDFQNEIVPENEITKNAEYYRKVEDAAAFIRDRLQNSKRPVLMVGSGVRISGAHKRFLELVDRIGIPVCTAWNAHDAIWDEHPCAAGRPGILGERAGNFTVQNSDLLLTMGCRLSIRQVSYDWKKFARHAYKIMVDLDEAELRKPTLSIDYPVHADLSDVVDALLSVLKEYKPADDHKKWLEWVQERRRKYPVVLKEYWSKPEPVNPYCFMEALFKELSEDEIIVCGDGTCCVVTFQAAFLKKGQRLYHNSGCASMGYDLPAAVGACFANGKKRTICLAGDGSIQMNIQELQTIVTHRLPIKIFVLNNAGYHSIRQTQMNYFSDSLIGFDSKTGVECPDMERISVAYGIPFRRIKKHSDLFDEVRAAIDGDGPAICEIMLDIHQGFSPKLASKRLSDGSMVSPPLEDMYPFLPREELEENMLVPLLKS